MMTIDEAIEHAEWCAENSCGECAEEHQQLAEWLKELVKVKAENEKLMGELEVEHALAESLGHSHELSQAENAKLRKYAQWLEGMVEDGWWDPIVNVQRLFDDKRVELGIEVD